MKRSVMTVRDLRDIGRELERSGKAGAIRELADSAEGKKLGNMLDAQAAERAVRSGDAAALREMLGRVLATDEGKKLAENVRKLMEK